VNAEQTEGKGQADGKEDKDTLNRIAEKTAKK